MLLLTCGCSGDDPVGGGRAGTAGTRDTGDADPVNRSARAASASGGSQQRPARNTTTSTGTVPTPGGQGGLGGFTGQPDPPQDQQPPRATGTATRPNRGLIATSGGGRGQADAVITLPPDVASQIDDPRFDAFRKLCSTYVSCGKKLRVIEKELDGQRPSDSQLKAMISLQQQMKTESRRINDYMYDNQFGPEDLKVMSFIKMGF